MESAQKDEANTPSLGVTLCEGGANIAVYSADADRIEFCLFDEAGRESRTILATRANNIHHGLVPNVASGQRYGLRAHGPWRPHEGLRFNPAKLLLDPYARRIERPLGLTSAIPNKEGELDDLLFDPLDTAPLVPKGIIEPCLVATLRQALSPPPSRIIYELNVRGFTQLHPDIPPALRGTFAGLAHPAAIDHLVKLGITTVELMPVAAWLDERHLPALGLSNAWGYNPVAFMAPDPRLAPGGMADVAAAVDALHQAGLEVILDVVFNHTAESDERGQTLSLRGLDNRTYYRLADDPRFYVNDTGCGHILACDRPPVIKLVIDALCHWVRAAGIDGFRFDLATALGRSSDGFSSNAPLFAALSAESLLKDRVMIAEPWDIGSGGYQLGHFPDRWLEWNDRYRDDVRRFWRGDGAIASLATRLAGSSDIFGNRDRKPSASVNFIATHDGFTLADLVSYQEKHNEANGENNRDGHSSEVSWNNGVEGPSNDAGVKSARAADVRALLATLLLSRGTPMLSMGDEFGRTQHGNNNAYAQDNETTWLHWPSSEADDLTDYVANLCRLRASAAQIHADSFLTGERDMSGVRDVTWLDSQGHEMTEERWHRASQKILGMWLGPVAGSKDMMIWINGMHQAVEVTLPSHRRSQWSLIFSSSEPHLVLDVSKSLSLPPRGVVVLQAKNAVSNGVDDDLLDELAEAAGLMSEWYEVSGRRTVVSADTKRALLIAMGFACNTRSQALDALGHLAELRILRADPHEKVACHLPDWLVKGERRFGFAAHLYTLRRVNDQGIGDFTTLRQFADLAAAKGASTIALNPLHALFVSDRERASPYQPSDRRFLDPHYIDLAAVPEVRDANLLASRSADLAALHGDRYVDYPALWRLKRDVLWQVFRMLPHTPDRQAAFLSFRNAGGAGLHRFARFQALEEIFGKAAHLQKPDAPADEQVTEFYTYLQFLADEQLAHAAASALELGLCRDLAIGAAPDGAEVWSEPGVFMPGVTIGSPPDPFSAEGQVWSLPPLHPWKLLETDFAYFRGLLRANMRHAGALRIDHVMALKRLFIIPDGGTAADGAYVAYPFEGMIAALAQESERARCLVIGEDLGTVPAGFRERMAEANILSYRVLFFERDGLSFLPPGTYPNKAVACVATHDLPTLKGWWSGADIELRRRLGSAVADDALLVRRDERKALLDAAEAADEELSPATTAAIHAHVAGSRAALALVQVEDLVGEDAPVNVPGTSDEYPNWRRRLDAGLAEILETPEAEAVLQIMRESGRASKDLP